MLYDDDDDDVYIHMYIYYVPCNATFTHPQAHAVFCKWGPLFERQFQLFTALESVPEIGMHLYSVYFTSVTNEPMGLLLDHSRKKHSNLSHPHVHTYVHVHSHIASHCKWNFISNQLYKIAYIRCCRNELI